MRSNDLPKVTQLVSNRARIQNPHLLGTKALALNHQGSFHLCQRSSLLLILSEPGMAWSIAGVQQMLTEWMNLGSGFGVCGSINE